MEPQWSRSLKSGIRPDSASKPVGNVIDQLLAEIVSGSALAAIRTELGEAFAARAPIDAACKPDCKSNCTPGTLPAVLRIAWQA